MKQLRTGTASMRRRWRSRAGAAAAGSAARCCRRRYRSAAGHRTGRGERRRRKGDHAQAASAVREPCASGAPAREQVDLQLTAAREWLAADRADRGRARACRLITGR